MGRFRRVVRVPWGDDRFDRLLAASPELVKLQGCGEEEIKSFSGLVQDIFYALLLPRPRVRPFGEITTSARLNKYVVEQLLKNRDFRQARRFTVDNPVSAAMGVLYYAELLRPELGGEIPAVMEEIFILEKAHKNACSRGEAAGFIAENAKDNPGLQGLFTYKKRYWAALAGQKDKELHRQAARLNVVLNSRTRKALGVLGGANRPGHRQGRTETGADGWDHRQGQWTKGGIEEHLKQVDHYLLSPKLQRLVQRIGRLKELPRARFRPEDRESYEEVAGITFGCDLAMVAPDEWYDYFHPERNIYFKKKFAEEALCLYEMAGKKEKGRGSMIICLDNSGSMQGPREEVSKALTIAMLEMAVKEKRDFVVIMFGGPDDELQVFEMPGGQCGYEQLLEIGEYFLCSSGTDFERPLRVALGFLEKDKYPGGDIIFITDGVCSVSAEFLEQYRRMKKARKFRTISVLVNYGQVPTAPVEAFSDEVLFSKDLKGHDIAGALFGMMESGE